jgi:hypothetical protein
MKSKVLLIIILSLFVTAKSKAQDTTTAIKDKYIVFFLTNTSVDQADSINEGKNANTSYTFVGELPQLFGSINKDSTYKYAYGLPGPMLLTQSVDEMQYEVNKAFDIAEKYGVPVYFQLDDNMNYTKQFGSGATPKFYDSTDWCEWIAFPKGTESWGGESNGRLPYNWFNWGSWMHVEAVPAFQSVGFRGFVLSQLKNGVLTPLLERYNKLVSEGKGYLFAGLAVGWETHIPDNSDISKSDLPVNTLLGDTMQAWEASAYGYNSLYKLGYTSYNRQALYQVIHDYSELIAKTVYEAGIPKNKIFTHTVGLMSSSAYRNLATTNYPPIWTAVNQYSIPGYTLSPYSCPYNLTTLVSDIKSADTSQKYFACAEGYSAGVDGSYTVAYDYFNSMFSNGAALVTVFGWGREAATSAFAVSHSQSSPFVLAAKVWMNAAADTALATEWNFNNTNSLDGWTLTNNLTGSLKNNVLVLKVTGTNPYLVSTSGLNIEADKYGYISIKMYNTTGDTSAQLYWKTETDNGFIEKKSSAFKITASDTSFTEYRIKVSDNSLWYGRIDQLRLDPVNSISSGTVKLEQVKLLSGLTSIKQENAEVPVKYELLQNYPNPFNPTTTIKYSIPKSGLVTLKVYNILGQEVSSLVNREQKIGTYNVTFDASKLASGVYMYKIQSGSYSLIKKMMLLK